MLKKTLLGLTCILLLVGLASANVALFKGYAVNTRNQPLSIGTPIKVVGYESTCFGAVDGSDGHFYVNGITLPTGYYTLIAGTGPNYLYSEGSYYFHGYTEQLGTVRFSAY